ncbi:hypothetical protein GQX73_g7171 [Xylaria multiplex]|uniref:FAD-binding PCMH-type domain-containing protein n=1 Tax=Xylaria multiplex TaxID=323545 RepID=A0A7C8MJP0_9PEZI|nr:hypothetical protein GQX73_g7171 [Xylaria multiplex]
MDQFPNVDLCALPLSANPDGSPPNFDDPPSLQPILIALTAILLTLATVITAGRLYMNRNALKLADYCMIVGLAFDIGIASVLLASSNNYRHPWDTPICWYTTLTFVEVLVVGPALFFPKAAIFLFYLQIFSVNEVIRIGSKIGLVAAFLGYFPASFALIYYDAPHIGQTWEDVITSGYPEKGIPGGIAIGVASVIVDIYIFILPLPTIFSLNIARSKKIQLICLFTTAFFGIVASVTCLVFRVKLLGLDDIGWQSGRVAIAIIAENNVAIIVGSLPAFANFLRTYVSQATFYKSLRSKLSFGSSNYASDTDQHGLPRNRSLWTFGSPPKRQLQYHELSNSAILTSRVTVPDDVVIATHDTDRILRTVGFSQETRIGQLSEASTYESSLASYFSIQATSVRPACIVSPETAEDVAKAVRIMTGYKRYACPFAIRSGGHAAKANAANIEGGVTLDLRLLNSVDVSPDKLSVSIGVGNTWDAVYSKLDSMNLSVNGGRTAGVGVGGLILGGGISYFGTRYGWTADTITNYEVVLADGSIINTNVRENSALFWALKGGGNNFGIITRININAFAQGPFWGGFLYYPNTVWGNTVKEFVNINSATAYDEYAALTLSWGYSSSLGTLVACNMQYTTLVENPPLFAGLTGLPALFGNLQITNMTQFALGLRSQQVYGERQLWATNTFISTEASINATYRRFNESVQAFMPVANITVAYTLEPLPPALYARKVDNNPFNLGTKNQSLVIALFTASWTDPADDGRVEKTTRTLTSAIEEDTRRLGAYNPFLYPNYAAPWQNPIVSYGAESVGRLQKVARDFDPHGVFTRQVPGGFKLT